MVASFPKDSMPSVATLPLEFSFWRWGRRQEEHSCAFSSQMEIVEHAKKSEKIFWLMHRAHFSRCYQRERTIFWHKNSHFPWCWPSCKNQHWWYPNDGPDAVGWPVCPALEPSAVEPTESCCPSHSMKLWVEKPTLPFWRLDFFSSVTAVVNASKKGQLPLFYGTNCTGILQNGTKCFQNQRENVI